MRRGALGVALVALALLALSSCEGRAPSAASAPSGPPRRIVSLAPSITETLFAVGAGDRVVAVTSHCDHPGEAAARPKVGGYNTPNVELIFDLAPDLVLIAEEGPLDAAAAKMRRLGLCLESVRVASLDELAPAIERVAALAGEGAQGRAAAERVRRAIARTREAVAGRRRPRALLIVDHGPTIAVGRGTFLEGVLEAAGGENVAATAMSAYPQLSIEAIAALAPEVIVDASHDPLARPAALASIPGARLVAIPPELLVRPGPRLAVGLEQLARALHPEAFGGAAAGRP